MKNLRVARRYAKALMAVAEEQNALEEIAQDLETISALIRSSRELRLLIASPVVSPEKKTRIFKVLFETRVSTTALEFVYLMTSKHREAVLPEVIEQFTILRDDKLGIVNAEVTVAAELSPSQEKNLVSRLERYTGKKVRLRAVMDRAIKGGLVVRIGDTVLDGSVVHQLALLRERFTGGSGVSQT